MISWIRNAQVIFVKNLRLKKPSFKNLKILKTWDLEGGGSNWLPPPQHILVFKYPSRDRVKSMSFGRVIYKSIKKSTN